MLHYAAALGDLRSPPGNRLEALNGDYAGYHSLRINDRWRVVFQWSEAGPTDVRIVTTSGNGGNMFTLDREPTGPGEILSEEFLKPMNITQRQLAEHVGCDVKVINRIVNGRTAIRAELAIRLASTLDTSPEFWLNAQQAVDVYSARRKIRDLPEAILMR